MEDLEDVFRGNYFRRWSRVPSYTEILEKIEKIRPFDDDNKPVHQPLLREKEDFRLVLLHPSLEFASPIECTLKNAAFKNCVPYEALSYAWGNPSETRSIILNQRKLEVTINLEEALRHLRQPYEVRTLWIDALSINQNDIPERNQQVALMKKIYSSCAVDIVWLSKANEELEIGFQIAANLEKAVLSRSIDQVTDDEFALWYIEDKDGRSLQKLFVELAVWNRVWVMQEISCAPRITLMLGTKTLDWEILAKFLGRNQSPDAFHAPFSHSTTASTIKTVFKGIRIIEHQRQIMRDIKDGYESRLLDVLARFRFTHATNPRDKIYGLLGLASDTMGVRVDYSKSVRDVYVDIFEAYTDITQNLDLLCQSQWGVSDVSISGERLPSWCPDFSRPGETVLLFAQRSIFCAGKEHCDIPCDVSPSGQLNLNGIRLGTITSLHDHSKDSERIHQDIRAFETMTELVLGENKDKMPTTVYEPTGEDMFQAFWRTCIADCKIYPTERLDAPDIEEITNYKETSFQKWQQDKIAYESTRVPQSNMMRKMALHWTFGLSEYGFYCMVPKISEVGDKIVVLDGGKVPMVIRPVVGSSSAGGEDQCHKVVGTAYVHGFMDGQAMEWQEAGRLKAGEIILE